MRIIFILFSFSLIVFGFDIKDLANSIKKDNISGEFNESLHLEGFEKPIFSNGEFFIRNKELLWKIKKPIENTVKISQDGVYQLDENQWIKLKDSLFDKEMFLNIINLNINELNKTFSIALSGDKSSWKVVLNPKSVIVKKVINKIIISGGTFVKKIEFYSSNGDLTVNEFYNVK